MATWFLLIIYLAFISLGLPDSLLGAAWPVMWPELGASLGSAGLLSMIIAGGTIISSLASGTVVQRLGVGHVTWISCLMTAVALLGFSMAPSMFWLILLAIPLGLGAGSVDAALNHYVAANYKAHHMSWLHCFWGVGATMGPIIMAASIAGSNTWRSGYLTVAIIQFVLVFILLAALPLWKRVAASRETASDGEETVAIPETTEPTEEDARVRPSLFRMRGIKPSLFAFLLYCGAEMTVGLWGASYLVGARQILPETAAAWVSMYYGGITVGRLVAGFITLRVSNTVLIRWGQWVTVAGGILLVLPLPGVMALVAFILIGLGLAPIYPGLLHETPARFGKAQSARLMGYQMAVAYTGTTILPPLFGWMAAVSSIAIFPAVVLGILILMLLSAERVNRVLKTERQL